MRHAFQTFSCRKLTAPCYFPPHSHSHLLRQFDAGQDKAAWEKDLAAWRADHAADLQKPDGWLALAGLVWLDAGDNSMGSGSRQ